MTLPVKIAFIGPESTGKTTLARRLSQWLNVPYVPEAARLFLQKNGPHYRPCDILTMAMQQIEAEHAALRRSSLIVTDTNAAVYYVWWLDKVGPPHPLLEDFLLNYDYITLLLGPDIPWTPDPLREDPHRREDIMGIYEQELTRFLIPYHRIEGRDEERWRQVLRALAREERLSAGRRHLPLRR